MRETLTPDAHLCKRFEQAAVMGDSRNVASGLTHWHVLC